MAQGLGAIADNIKKRKEAEEAARGGPAIEGLKAATPKPDPPPPAEKPKPAPKAAPIMPKDEVDALRIEEQKRYETRRKAQEGQK